MATSHVVAKFVDKGVAGQAAEERLRPDRTRARAKEGHSTEGVVVARDQSNEVGFGFVTGRLDLIEHTVGRVGHNAQERTGSGGFRIFQEQEIHRSDSK